MGKRNVEIEADRLAEQAKSSGYPDAEPAYMYCIDEIGPDDYYTRTVCVYLGKPDPVAVARHERAKSVLEMVMKVLVGTMVAMLVGLMAMLASIMVNF